MLDTCIFNWVLDGSIQMEQLRAEYQYFITHIQRDELDRETSGQRKKQLLKVLNTINPQCIHTESMVLGISRLGMCRLSGDDFFEKFISFLNKINNNKRNNGKEALRGF